MEYAGGYIVFSEWTKGKNHQEFTEFEDLRLAKARIMGEVICLNKCMLILALKVASAKKRERKGCELS